MIENNYGLIVPTTNKQCLLVALVASIAKKRNGEDYTNKTSLPGYYKNFYKVVKENNCESSIVIQKFCNQFRKEIRCYLIDGTFIDYFPTKEVIDKKKAVIKKGKIIRLFSHVCAIKENSYSHFQKDLDMYASEKPTNENRPVKKMNINAKQYYKRCNRNLNNKYLSFDFETFKKGEKSKVAAFACGLYGENISDFEYRDFWINDNLDEEELLNRFVDQMIQIIKNDFEKSGKKHNYIIFSHNGGKFDIALITKRLIKNQNLQLYYKSVSQPLIARNTE
jgi:hypothetical protein